MPRVLLIGTEQTKGAALRALTSALEHHGLTVEMVDISLRSTASPLDGAAKLDLMAQRAREAAKLMSERRPDCIAAVALGGGTGGEIAFGALKGLPARFPKFLITTMAFDPRGALADTAITLIPTLCDIEGVNGQLNQVFEEAAAMVAGVARMRTVPQTTLPRVGITTLGATGQASGHLAEGLERQGYEATVYHANGYGGAAFVRATEEAQFDAVIDLNVHELGRIRLAGAHVPMAARFTAAGHLPRVVLPGALNFIGLGTPETIAPALLNRPHYRHSGHFTHVKLTESEMADQARALAEELNAATAPTHVLIPMGGFSHEDRPGGAIEDASLREIAAEHLTQNARAYTVSRITAHINDPETAQATIAILKDTMAAKDRSRRHA